eukprot:179911-Amorphochlora_amoeboformis.AAC.1
MRGIVCLHRLVLGAVWYRVVGVGLMLGSVLVRYGVRELFGDVFCGFGDGFKLVGVAFEWTGMGCGVVWVVGCGLWVVDWPLSSPYIFAVFVGVFVAVYVVVKQRRDWPR